MSSDQIPPELQRVLESEDYHKMQGLVNSHLASIAGADEDELTEFYTKTLAGEVDVQALVVFAMTRASTVSSTNPTLTELLSSMWLEGFLMGKIYDRPS